MYGDMGEAMLQRQKDRTNLRAKRSVFNGRRAESQERNRRANYEVQKSKRRIEL